MTLLSLVVPVRVGYGGDFLHRLQAFVDVQSTLLARHNIDAELIVVEWNPPLEPRVAQAIRWPQNDFRQRIRIIEVPHEIHERFPNAELFSIFEFIAKNVGIRRAKGEFILSMNADILLGEDMVRWLSSSPSPLSPDCYYRVDRHDVDGNVPLETGADGVLAFCQAHTVEIARRYGTVRPGWAGQLQHWWLAERRAFLDRAASPERRRFHGLHTNAAGDFLLMHRDAWDAIRGYPEYPTYFFLDGYGVSNAAALGLNEAVLSAPVYHQNHGRGGNDKLPKTSFAGWRDNAETAFRSGAPFLANDESWGLANDTLREISV